MVAQSGVRRGVAELLNVLCNVRFVAAHLLALVLQRLHQSLNRLLGTWQQQSRVLSRGLGCGGKQSLACCICVASGQSFTSSPYPPWAQVASFRITAVGAPLPLGGNSPDEQAATITR